MKRLLLFLTLLAVTQTIYAQTNKKSHVLTSGDLVEKAVDKLNHGDFEGAITDCDKAMSLDPKNSEAYNWRGGAKFLLGRYADAIVDYDKAVALNPKDADPYYNRGFSKIHLERYSDAIVDFAKAIAINPKYTDAYNYQGYAYFKLGGTKANYRKAVADYDKAIQLGGDDYKPNYEYRHDASVAIAKAKGQ